MYEEITTLESTFDSLLPDRKINASPAQELLATARAWSEEVWKAGKIAGPLSLSNEQIDNGKRLIERPVFICGVHRSGTTLLRDLLDGHPSLTVLPSEGTFLTNLSPRLQQMKDEEHDGFLAKEWLRRLANPINQPPYWLLGRSSTTSSPYVNFSRAFKAWYAIAKKDFSKNFMWPHLAVALAYATCANQGTGLTAKYWVDKTPTHERYLDKIWHEMPGAKIIHIVRDPTDVFLSRRHIEPSLNLKTFLKDLQLSYDLAVKQSRLNNKNYLLLHYEALCENPQACISRVTEMLNIELLACLFTPTVAGKLANVNSSFAADLPAGSIIKKRTHANGSLSGKERKLLSAHLYKSAAQLGYNLDPIGAIQSSLLKLKLRLL